jgi:phospholipid/cholesterol/gamma-HCH transport system substrate-binding protein
MAPPLSWSKLLPGIITVVVLTTATVALLMFSSVGRVTGEKIRLYVATNSAHGVMRGTEVWLAGQKVGVVDGVGFNRVSADTAARVVLAVDVRRSDAVQIRRDSEIRVRAGANLIGPVVVYISAGTPGSAAVRNGDTLTAARRSDAQDAMRRLGEATKELDPLMQDARTVLAHAKNPNGTLGALMRSGVGEEVADLRAQVNALRQQFGGSSAPRTDFMNTAKGALAQVDSIRLLLRSNETSLGRFRRDTTLGRTLAGVRAEVAELRARLTENDGSLGRFAADSAIHHALADAQSELTLLMEDLRKRPLRYLAF